MSNLPITLIQVEGKPSLKSQPDDLLEVGSLLEPSADIIIDRDFVQRTDLNALKSLYDNKARMYKIYYEKAHFIRWGTTGEEYSYV